MTTLTEFALLYVESAGSLYKQLRIVTDLLKDKTFYVSLVEKQSANDIQRSIGSRRTDGRFHSNFLFGLWLKNSELFSAGNSSSSHSAPESMHF